MHREHIHIRQWMHTHRIDWHEAGVHFGHWIHDPRFWAILAAVIVSALMIIGMLLSTMTNVGDVNYRFPTYPYLY